MVHHQTVLFLTHDATVRTAVLATFENDAAGLAVVHHQIVALLTAQTQVGRVAKFTPFEHRRAATAGVVAVENPLVEGVLTFQTFFGRFAVLTTLD